MFAAAFADHASVSSQFRSCCPLKQAPVLVLRPLSILLEPSQRGPKDERFSLDAYGR